MQIVDNILILLLPVIAFYAGKKISDKYNSERIEELGYIVRLQATERGIGYIAPQTSKKFVPIGQPFMDKLKENGRATQRLDKPPTK